MTAKKTAKKEERKECPDCRGPLVPYASDIDGLKCLNCRRLWNAQELHYAQEREK